MTRRQFLGLEAHIAVESQYLALHHNGHVIADRTIYPPGSSPLRIAFPDWFDPFTAHSDPYPNILRTFLQTSAKSDPYDDFLGPSLPGFSRRPDLASIELHEVYETKPDTPSGRSAGRAQIEEFRGLLQRADEAYRRGRDSGGLPPSNLFLLWQRHSWTVGLWTPFQVLVVDPLGKLVGIEFRNRGDGLILWKETPTAQPHPHPYLLPRSMAQEIRRLVPDPPQDEGTATVVAHYLRNAIEGLAREIDLNAILWATAIVAGGILVALALPEIAVAVAGYELLVAALVGIAGGVR